MYTSLMMRSSKTTKFAPSNCSHRQIDTPASQKINACAKLKLPKQVGLLYASGSPEGVDMLTVHRAVWAAQRLLEERDPEGLAHAVADLRARAHEAVGD